MTSAPITYGSVCSGIEAPGSAWHPLGWKPLWFSEIEAFPKAVLAHHYPTVPDLGDMTTLPARILAGEVPAPDVFVGGTPCQSFSVAGLRKGLADPRGQLTRTFVEIIDALDTVRLAAGKPPVVTLYENVPGILSDKDNAFGNFLGALAGEDDALLPPGGRWSNCGCVLGPQRTVAWRVLDAQYFGVAQRRRRVFAVISARSSAVDPVEVLLVEQGLRRDTPPSREAWQGAPAPAARSADAGGEGRSDGTGSNGGRGGGVMEDVAQPLRSNPYNNSDPLMEARMHIVERVVAPQAIGFEPRYYTRDNKTGGGPSSTVSITAGGASKFGDAAPCVAHVVAPPLTATNDPSRSPQSAEVTAQVHAVLRAQNWDGQDTAPTLTGRLYGGLGAQTMPDKGNMGAVLQPVVMAHGQANAEVRTDGAAPTLVCVHEAPIVALQAHAVHENQRAEVTLSPVVGTLKCAGGKPGQGYPTVLAPASGPSAVPYDLFQITAPLNRQSRDERSPCHTLAKDNAAHAAVVVGVFQQSSMEGKGTIGFSSEDLAKPVKTQVDGQMLVTTLARDNAAHAAVVQPMEWQGGSQQDQVLSVNAVCPSLAHSSNTNGGNHQPKVLSGMAVRRLTPEECERLQGFPDNHTRIPWKGKPASDCPDGPRYRALGNSMAVPVIAWIGRKIEERIAAAEAAR